MKKFGFKKPKASPLGKAFGVGKGLGMPKGPKGPEAMRKTPAPSFGRVKRTRGAFGPPPGEAPPY